MSVACKSCDGRGFGVKHTRWGPEVSKNLCSLCGGSGLVKPPSKGGKFYRTSPKNPDEDGSIESMTRAFLAKHGY